MNKKLNKKLISHSSWDIKHVISTRSLVNLNEGRIHSPPSELLNSYGKKLLISKVSLILFLLE